MENAAISAVRVWGLHHQLDVDVRLNPGLNVLYGKNGRGKTTLLHIIANSLELDFQRFQSLQFLRIEIDTFGGSRLEITRSQATDIPVRVVLDGVPLSDNSLEKMSQDERLRVRSALGSRPVYLPAFRSILERVRSESFYDSQKNPEFERIREEERAIEREVGSTLRRTGIQMARADVPGVTAKKTIQCREWFGDFVPVVRYPSIIDVIDRLSIEYRDAQLETGMFERRMLSEMFVEVLKALLSKEDIPSESEVDTLLDRVRTALDQEKDRDAEFKEDDLGIRLAQVVATVKDKGENHAGAAERRVLRLYANMLERRSQARQTSFAGVRQFESAINKFLDNKTLHITEGSDLRHARFRQSVYVESGGNRKYSLSSLSSGERQVLTMLFSATRMSVATGIFLIDEPELSLHVDWQRIILSEIMAQAGNRQIIACTHSPEVGADHSDAVQIFDPASYSPPLPEPQEESSDSLLDDTL